MPETFKKLRIFVAYPSDVAKEYAKLRAVADSLKPTADRLGLILDVIHWRDVVPDMGRAEQVIFDELKPTSWDIFVGILWHRFGTPPGAKDPQTQKDYLSGTEEEFRTAYRLRKQFNRPRIVMYRCICKIPSDTDSIQVERVEKFFDEIENPDSEFPVLTQSFKTLKSFEKLWHENLQKLLNAYDQIPQTSNTLTIQDGVDSSFLIPLPLTSSNPSIVNKDLAIYSHPPFGEQKFHGIRFYVENARISMADVFDSNSKKFNLQEPILGIRSIYFLINAGDGRKRYGEVAIGHIELFFKDDSSPQRFEVKLIKNVREWAIGNYVTVIVDGQEIHDPLVNSVKDEHISHEAWRGTTNDGQVAVIDMLRVKVDESKYDKPLVAIRFTRDIPSGKCALDYFVSGITVELLNKPH